MPSWGVLLINLGTPDESNPKSVYKYLKEFLNDPRVVDLPKLIRYVLVNGLIVPFRYKKSAHAYQQIWQKEGSPLLVNTQRMLDKLANKLGDNVKLALGMRYGNPSIKSALNQLKDCEKIITIPLFPQYASAATGSAIEAFLKELSTQWNIPQFYVINNFFNDPGFIAAYAHIIKENISAKNIDLLVFSYHGLPERHIEKSHCRTTCSKVTACPSIDSTNAYCYRAQCYETSRLLAQALNLTSNQYQVTFQSRLGRTPWIKPYTDLALPEFINQGIKNIAIVSPSFVADCLETLEEINIRTREQWQSLGGKEFTFIPCLNDHPLWIDALANMLFALKDA